MEIKRDEIEKLIPSTINFNYDELKAEIDERLEHYKGKSSTSEDNYKERKADRAKLNALAKSLAQERTNVRNILLAPLTSKGGDTHSFGEKIDILINSIKEVVNQIDTGIKEYEDSKRDEKRALIMEYLEEQVRHGFGSDECRNSPHWKNWANEQMVRSRSAWLTATMPIKAIQREIDEEVSRCVSAFNTMLNLISEEDEMTKIKARNALVVDFSLAEMSSAVSEYIRETEELKKRNEERIRKEEEQLKSSVKVTEENKKEPMFKYTITFVGTRDAISNLKQYLEINNGLSYKITERKAL